MQRVALASLIVGEGVPDTGRLHHHLRQRVRDHVMELVRDPCALFGGRARLGGRDLLAQLARLSRSRGERDAEETAQEGAHDRTVTRATAVRVLRGYDRRIIPTEDAYGARAAS